MNLAEVETNRVFIIQNEKAVSQQFVHRTKSDFLVFIVLTAPTH